MKYARSGIDVVPERESSVGQRGDFFEVACAWVWICGNSWEFLGVAWEIVCGFVGIFGRRVRICVWIRGNSWGFSGAAREFACGFVEIHGNFWELRGKSRVDSWEFAMIFGGRVGICVWIRGNFWELGCEMWEFACGFVGIFGSSRVKCGNLRVGSCENNVRQL